LYPYGVDFGARITWLTRELTSEESP
jgi:hypothetical protein